jgi:hypothetical protein
MAAYLIIWFHSLQHVLQEVTMVFEDAIEIRAVTRPRKASASPK